MVVWLRRGGIIAIVILLVFIATTLPVQSFSKMDMTQKLTSTNTGFFNSTSPLPTELSKAIIIGQLMSENTDWVEKHLAGWTPYIYIVDLPPNVSSPTGLKTSINKAHEAMPYLTYIIDHYPHFPDIMTFLHAHRHSWHMDDTVVALNELRLNTVIQRGYVNLRCQHVPGCPDEIQPYRDPPDPTRVPEQIFPEVFSQLFNLSFSEARPRVEVVATPCCAQFAVTRDQILKRPKEDYEHYRRFIHETHYDAIGNVFEYMWHIIFGQDVISCEDVKQCRCDVYGQCEVMGTKPPPF